MVKSRRRSRLPKSIQLELLKSFCAGATARSAGELKRTRIPRRKTRIERSLNPETFYTCKTKKSVLHSVGIG